MKGDELVTGRHCSHKYHKCCLLEWLGEGGHDGCPVCRELIMTPAEFKETAVECIKPKRLQRLATKPHDEGGILSITNLITPSPLEIQHLSRQGVADHTPAQV